MSKNSGLPQSIQSYTTLIDAFISGEIDTTEFEKKYLAEVKSEKRILPHQIYAALQELFEDVDAYVHDPKLRTDPEDLDDEQLMSSALRVRGMLSRLGL